MWWNILIALGAGLLAAWLALLITLALIRPKGTLLAEAIRLLPDLVRLLRRLTADRTLPRGVRVRLGLLMVYLALPIDLIPDFLPVIGYADDAIIVAFVLRSVVRRAGIESVRAHWSGSDDGFAALSRLAGLHRAEPRK
ncbi:YkvA family protein [Streptomyces asiaticus]|uniref:YkvA family protein n=1 Tax=Streptomyces asiaticus TaxID=114695 RepID=UPI003D753D4D